MAFSFSVREEICRLWIRESALTFPLLASRFSQRISPNQITQTSSIFGHVHLNYYAWRVSDVLYAF